MHPARTTHDRRVWINWRRVYGVMRAHDWNWAALARRMAVTESHLSMVRNGRRSETFPFIKMLAWATQLNWEHLLHPMTERIPTAREMLALTEMEDGRPLLDAERDHRTAFQLHRQDHTRARALDRLLGAKEKT